MASKYDGAVIEVKNWETYNPRGDSKRPSWLRLDNDFLTNPSFIETNCEHLIVWIAILCQVSQKNGQPIRWKNAFLEKLKGLSFGTQDQAIEMFIKDERIKVTRTDPCEDVRDSHELARYERTNERTNITNERDETNKESKGAVAIATAPNASQFIGTWVKSWQGKFGPKTRPDLGGKVQGQIKRFLKDVTMDRACSLAQVYFQMDDRWFQTKSYDFGTFIENLGKIGIALDTGKDPSGTSIDWGAVWEKSPAEVAT